MLDGFDLPTLLVVSCVCALAVEAVKRAVRLAAPEVTGHAAWRPALRLLGVLAGVGLVVGVYGPSLIAAMVGGLAGAASEVVYRWALRWLTDRLAAIG